MASKFHIFLDLRGEPDLPARGHYGVRVGVSSFPEVASTTLGLQFAPLLSKAMRVPL